MTALCLTRNRPTWLRKAIQCFQAQTYHNRELLIIADGADVREVIPDDERIRLIQIEEGYTIGEKRNFGVAQALGEVIAHWDDDDLSAPGRIADQLERLEQSGKAVTGYSSMLFTGDAGTWRYTGLSSYALGTSLCYRKSWWQGNPFPPKQVGEDGDFVRAAWDSRQLITSASVEMMTATIHSNNTSPRQLSGDEWTRIS